MNKYTSMLTLTLALLMATTGTLLAEEASQCVTCHKDLDEELSWPVAAYEEDVHKAAGLSCHHCHGGNPEGVSPDEAMHDSPSFVGRPDPLEMPLFCDKCHGSAEYMKQYNPGLPVDQLAKYRTSVHGKLNAQGDEKAAQCASCHEPHRMKPANDPTASIYPLNLPNTCATCHADKEYMAPYGIPTDQFEQYSQSVHGQALLVTHDLGAPACNDCHGNHAASPPLEAAIPNVCGNCHAFNAQLFAESPHKEAYADAGIPACESCHGVHEIHILTTDNLGDGDESTCIDCHDPDDGTRGIETAVSMQKGLYALEHGYEHAESLLVEAERRGMYVKDAEYMLNDVRQSVIQAHTLVHSFNDTVVGSKVDSGLLVLAGVTGAAEEKLAESAFRRWGLLVSTLIISLVAGLLYLKIRQLEGK